jgi:hypothetical protein
MVNQSDTDLSAARICALRILINGMRANQSSGISETKTTTLALKNNYWHFVGLRLGELDKHETPIKPNDFTRTRFRGRHMNRPLNTRRDKLCFN